MQKMKRPLLILGIALGILSSIGFFYLKLHRAPNSEYGYYGQFNRVKNILEGMENVEIVDSWKHEDITLEDFGFTVTTSSSNTFEISFYEKELDNLPRNQQELRQLIDQKLNSIRNDILDQK